MLRLECEGERVEEENRRVVVCEGGDSRGVDLGAKRGRLAGDRMHNIDSS